MQRAAYTPPPEPGPGPAEDEDEDEDEHEKAGKNSILDYFLTSAAVTSTCSPAISSNTLFTFDDYNQILVSSHVKTRGEISVKNDGIVVLQETPDS